MSKISLSKYNTEWFLSLFGCCLSLGEPLECWKSMDIEACTEVLVCIGVNLGDDDRAFLGKRLSNDFVLRGEVLAVAAPRKWKSISKVQTT